LLVVVQMDGLVLEWYQNVPHTPLSNFHLSEGAGVCLHHNQKESNYPFLNPSA